MSLDLMPRFRGAAFEIDNAWSWEVIVTVFGDNDGGFMFKAKNTFSSKHLAIEDMKNAIKLACDDLQKNFMGAATGEYIDVKTNETLKWDTSNYN